MITGFEKAIEALVPRPGADGPYNAFAMAYEICNFTVAQCRNHTDVTGPSEAIKEATGLLENCRSSNTV